MVLPRVHLSPGGHDFGHGHEPGTENARVHEPDGTSLAAGLESETLGGRLDAINRFFDQIPTLELAALILPPNLSQLRTIYLSSRS